MTTLESILRLENTGINIFKYLNKTDASALLTVNKVISSAVIMHQNGDYYGSHKEGWIGFAEPIFSINEHNNIIIAIGDQIKIFRYGKISIEKAIPSEYSIWSGVKQFMWRMKKRSEERRINWDFLIKERGLYEVNVTCTGNFYDANDPKERTYFLMLINEYEYPLLKYAIENYKN
jgi:hypothetical protein